METRLLAIILPAFDSSYRLHYIKKKNVLIQAKYE